MKSSILWLCSAYPLNSKFLVPELTALIYIRKVSNFHEIFGWAYSDWMERTSVVYCSELGPRTRVSRINLLKWLFLLSFDLHIYNSNKFLLYWEIGLFDWTLSFVWAYGMESASVVNLVMNQSIRMNFPPELLPTHVKLKQMRTSILLCNFPWDLCSF